MLKKVLPVIMALLLVLMLLPACVAPAPPATPTTPAPPPAPKLPKEIKIGCLLCMTGALAAMGDLISKGAKLAVKDINAAGGIDGSTVKLLLEDTATDPSVALEAFKKLVEVNGVKVVIGPMISGASMAIGPYAKERGILYVSPSTTSPLISEQPWTDVAFRTCPSDTLQGKAMAKIILDKGFKRVAMMIMDNAYGVGIEEVAKKELAGKVEIVKSIRYDPEKLDYLTELGTIKDAKPDCVLHVGYHDDGAVVFRQALELGLDKIQWVSAEGVYGIDFTISEAADEFMTKAVIGTALTSVGPAYDEFCKRYKAEYGVEPGVYCDTVYDAVMMVAKAIKKAGVYDGIKIRDALREIGKNYEGVSGTITFNEKGDRISGIYQIWKVEKAPELKPPYKFTKIGLIPLG